ncbi:MAG: hypothetical protein SWK90_14450 [Chloroflexota bacterium]|nr:hypothetical protein [Chloroflexota bacterium]
MSKVKTVLGYIVASLSIPIILATFMGMPFWSKLLVSTTGVTISPWFTGGEVARTVDHDTYRTDIHRPVFDALIGERKQGFVQVDWAPLESLPARIDEEVDVDGDGQADFRVEWDTASDQATLRPYASWVLGLERTYRLEDSLAVRVNLRNR